MRIRSNWTQHHFNRFDSSTRRFVPNAVRDFEYPLDNKDVSDGETTDSARRDELGSQIVSGVQQLASRLERNILDVTSCSEARG